MDPQLKAQLAQTIYTAAESSVDNYGDVTFASPATMAARVVENRRELLLPSGNRVVSSHTITTEDQIKMTDRIWLPGEDQTDATKARQPLAVRHLVDEKGATEGYHTFV